MDEPTPSAPATDETLTMQPRATFSCGRQARTIWKAAQGVHSPGCAGTRRHPGHPSCAASPNTEMPALLTSASMRPQRSTAPCAIARQSASCATSPRSTNTSAPAVAASGSAALGFLLAARVVDQQVVAPLRQHQRCGSAHARARAGDQGDFSLRHFFAPCGFHQLHQRPQHTVRRRRNAQRLAAPNDVSPFR